ncbi:hypothetical protein [Cellvibrio sp. KY-GH-1]|uniref:hypothetical protein n=1 Tax=Cellvibrio sp. KY-GH-1 TaxID=2303332 RepID=UPI001244BEF4|nr:hypothetical protein [Cellvibrio sp. KY-GH-1]
MEIVKKQHVFPAKSIARFYDSNGAVEVNLFRQSKVIRTTSKDQLFTVRRIWDQSAEQGFGLSIENKFQNLTDYVIQTKDYLLPPEANQLVTNFYVLWRSRSVITEKDFLLAPNVKIIDVQGVGLSDFEKNEIELNHGFYVNEDQTLPMRFQRGMVIKGTIDMFFDRNPSLRWYVCRSRKVEFTVPDVPSKYLIIPITPHICYSCEINYENLTKAQMTDFNLNSITRSKNYYFGRNLAKALY